MVAWDETHSSEIRSIPKLLAVLGYASGVGLGLIPYAAQVRSPSLLLIEILVVFGASASVAFSRREHSGPSITVRELVLGLLGRISVGALAGLFGVTILFPIRAVSWLLGFGLDGSSPWVFWISSVLMTTVTALLAVGDSVDIFPALYPQRIGQQSPFFAASIKQSTPRTIRIATLVVTLALLLSAVAYLAGQGWLAFFCGLVLVGVGSDYLQAKPPKPPTQVSASAMQTVKRLLEAAEYRVVLRPLTGDEDADAVVSTLDFLALRSDGGMAGWVRTNATKDDSDFHNGLASIESAVWVLQDRLQTNDAVKVSLEPMLIMIGAGTEDFPEKLRSLRIVHTPDEAELTAMVESAKGHDFAARLFGLSPMPTGKVA